MKNKKNIILIILIILIIGAIILLVLPDRDETISPPSIFEKTPTNIVLNPPNDNTIIEGETYKINASAYDDKNNILNVEFIYSSNDNNILTIDQTGLITAISPGTATITVKDKKENVTKQLEITVNRKEILAEKIYFSQKEYNITEGEYVDVSVVVEPDNTDNKNFKLSIDNNNVKLENNRVTGLKEGTTKLTVKLNNLSDTCTINVSKKTSVVNKITLSSPKQTISVGESVNLVAILEPVDAVDKTITWSVENSNICTNTYERITGVSKGTCKVTAKVGNVSKTISITVEQNNELEIHMFKGGGFYDDCILIKDDSTNVFIDGGRAHSEAVSYLQSQGIHTLDAIIGSHLDDDHISAHTAIVDSFDVKAAYYPNILTSCNGCDDQSRRTAQNVNNKLYSNGITPKIITPGTNPTKETIGDLDFYFLGPVSIGGNSNENSFVFILRFGNNQFLFTGDAESRLINYSQLKTNAQTLGIPFTADVLKYPHHGNATLDGNFLREINPQYVIVPNNGYGYGPTSANNIKNTSGATIYCLNGKNGCDNAPKTNNIIVHSDGNTVTVEN